jgi:CheY-like chemotaxis protein
MLQLPATTIRNWEERYGAVVPARSAGGQRLYSPDQVDQLRYVASQLALGLSAADAHRLLVEREAGDPPEVDQEPRESARPLVLIAERDPAAAEFARSALGAEDYEFDPVFTVADAEQRWIERGPAVAIVELMLAGGQGADLCRRLKHHAGGAVLAVSALEARDQALAAGADAFLHKPVDPLELRSTVEQLVPANARRVA